MHDRLTRLEEITEAFARSPLAKSGGVTQDELAMDAALVDLLFEKKRRWKSGKTPAPTRQQIQRFIMSF
jgi:hypothetical protein